MTVLKLESERFTPAGGIDGRAARRAIGKPDLAFWDLFLRETLQNSWDALAPGQSAIGFSVAVRQFSASETHALRHAVLHEHPTSLAAFCHEIESAPPSVIVVTDTNTRGLGGVTRADIAPVLGEPRDFVDFVRNIGRASEKALGGGTYGFGKSVLYDASTIGTIIAYSQVRVGEYIENRLIGLTVAEQYVSAGARFTGRHWWGAATDASFVEPLTGQDARVLAEQLGIASMPVTVTGTSIAVLSPALANTASLSTVATKIAEAARWWAWPHMVDLGSGPSIDFEFSSGDTQIELSDPATDPVLQHFVRAYEQASSALTSGAVQDQWPWSNREIVAIRPSKRTLGVLSYRQYSPADTTASTTIRSNIALMRSPRFVVKYLSVAEHPSGQATAGVFLTTGEANDEFAKAEPVAHDDWVAYTSDESRTSVVRIALNRIRDEFKQAALGASNALGAESATGVAAVSRVLGSILSGASGSGVELQDRPISSKKKAMSRPKVGVTLDPNPTLEFIGGDIVAEFGFHFYAEKGVYPGEYELSAVAKVVLDGGSVEEEKQRPLGATEPRVEGWYSGSEKLAGSGAISASLIASGFGSVRVVQPPGVAVTAVVSARHIG